MNVQRLIRARIRRRAFYVDKAAPIIQREDAVQRVAEEDGHWYPPIQSIRSRENVGRVLGEESEASFRHFTYYQ